MSTLVSERSVKKGMPMNSEPQKLREKIFILKITGLVIASVIVIATLLFIIFLPSRNKELRLSSDYVYVTDFIKDENNTRLSALTLGFISENITEFEASEDVTSTLLKNISPKNLSIAKAESYSDDKPTYTIYSQGKVYFEIVLAENGKTVSGFDKWKIESLSIPKNSEIGAETTLEVPHGAKVLINGKELSSGYILEENSAYYALTEFESNLADTYKSDIYNLGVIFSHLEIEASLEENRLCVSEYSDNSIKVAYPFSMTSVYSFTVPGGAEVFVNGILVEKEYIIKSDFKYPFLSRFENNSANPPTALTYQVSGLFNEPTVTVSYRNEILKKAEQGNIYLLPESAFITYKIFVPEDSSVKINDIPLGASEITAKNVDFPIMDGLKNYVKDRPHLVEYTVSGLMNTPKVTATDKNGVALKADIYSSDNNFIYFSFPASSQVPENDLVTLKAFAKAYVKYMYSGTSGLSGNYTAVTDMTPGKSLAFTKLKNAYKSLYSSDVYKNIKFGEAEFSNYTAYTDNAFSCTVKLPFTATLNGENVERKITIDILYIFSGKIRRVINYLEY